MRVFAFFADVVADVGGPKAPTHPSSPHVYCYVGAANEDAATARLAADLSHRGLRLVNVQWCVDQDSLVRDESPVGSAAAAEKLARGGQVVYQPLDGFA